METIHSEERSTIAPFLRLNEATASFIQQRVQLFSDGVSGQDLHKKLHIPYLKMPLPFFDHEKMHREARQIESQAVGHRSKDSYGWKSLCIHGIDAAKTMSSDRYGYASEIEAPYRWTEASQLSPETTGFLKELLAQNYFEKFYRVRFMYLEPGGQILFHQDRDEANKSLGPLNIALNMPARCHWVFEKWGTVPFEPGSGYAVDISNRHGVWNFSDETRIHLILHGKYGSQYYKALEDGARDQRNKAPQTAPIDPISSLKKTRACDGNFSCILWQYNDEIILPELLSHCANITEHFVRLKATRQNQVSTGIRLTDLLTKNVEAGHRWALVCTPGTLFKDRFFSQARDFLSTVSPDVFIVGHLLDRDERWFGLHPQAFFINLEIWEKLGRPSFGTDAINQELPGVLRSEENVHDNYTPLFIKKGTNNTTLRPKIFGWNWIKSALRSDYQLINFPQELREKKLFLYPEQNQSSLLERLNNISLPLEEIVKFGKLSSHQESVFSDLHMEAYGLDKKIFLFNTEQVRSPYQDGRIKKIDLYLGLPAGFMDLHLAYRHQLNENATFIYFDVNQSMLEIKKELFTHWNGQDFLAFWKNLELRRSDIFKDKLMTVNAADIATKWADELQIWGGEAEFKKTFDLVQTHQRTYLNINILESSNELIAELSRHRNKHIAFWYSNCFNYTPNLALNAWKMSELRLRGTNLMNALLRVAKLNNHKITLYGEDVVEGYKVQGFGKDIQDVFS